MNPYLAHTKKIADATPQPQPGRRHGARRGDPGGGVRALARRGPWLQANDDIVSKNSLEWIPYAGWVTWVVQVMPIFFLVGGYANGAGAGVQG